MKLERSKNAKRNLLWGTISNLIHMLLPFVVRTVIIYKLGADYLGLSSLFTSILQVLNLSELGFSSAVVYSMYKPIAEQDDEAVCALLSFYRRVYRIVGLVILIVGLCLLPFLPYLISGSYPDDINLYAVYIIYLVNTSLSYFLFAYKSSLLNAYQRTDVISNVKAITNTAMYAVQIALLFLFSNYYIYIIVMPVFTLANNIINAIMVKKMFPQYTCKGKVKPEIMKEIKTNVPGLMLNKLCATSRNSFDSIFVSAFLGLTATAIYNNYYYIFSAIVQIIAVISTSLLGGVGNSVATESKEKNYSDLKKFNFLYMWLGGWCTCCFLCLYQPFMKIWVGEDLMLSFSSVILFCLYFYVLKMGDLRALYVDATGLWWKQKWRSITEAALNLILNFVLVQFWGINGIIAATLISLFLINFCWGSQFIFKFYFQNGKLKEYFLQHLEYAVVTLLACVVTYFVCTFIPIEGVLGLIIKMLICVTVPNVIYLLCYRWTKQYGISMQWFLSILHLDKKLRFLLPKKKTATETIQTPTIIAQPDEPIDTVSSVPADSEQTDISDESAEISKTEESEEPRFPK